MSDRDLKQSYRRRILQRLAGPVSVTALAATVGLPAAPTLAADNPTPGQPNIVVILADDLGYGSLGYTGSTVFRTPRLDALAQQGVFFSQSYACPVCSPARSAINTGFHQGHGPIDRNVGSNTFRNEDILSGTVMQNAGYSTASFGKWGFGANGGTTTSSNDTDDLAINPVITSTASLPTTHGFETFYGYLSHGRAHQHFVDPLWEAHPGQPMHTVATGNNAGDNVTNTHAHFSDDLITDHALQYITDNAGQSQPFYMQVNLIEPHQDLDAIGLVNYDVDGNPQNWDAGYESSGLFDKQKKYAAMISRLDAHVGQIIDQLDDPDGDGDTSDSILDNTLIVFTSDNGGVSGDSLSVTGWNALAPNGVYRGGKQDLYEGGLRVPTIAYWRGVTEPGLVSDTVIDFADFLPTLADLAGVDAPIGVDGVSFKGALTGDGLFRQRDYRVWETYDSASPVNGGTAKDGRWAILDSEQYKLIRYADGTYELFSLATDPSESSPLDPVAYADRIATLQSLALAEGVEQPEGYKIGHADWIGSDGGDLGAAGNWSDNRTLADFSVATINNATGSASVVTAGSNLSVLGLEVKGDGALQTLVINSNQTVHGRNEVRINAGGRVYLDGGSLSSVRWVDVKADGTLAGRGQVTGDVYHWGLIAPGAPDDLQAQVAATSSSPVVDAIVFDFTGVQDPPVLTSTSTLDTNLQLVTGLHLGAGVSPRHAGTGPSNRGDEFNVQGMDAGSLAVAIANDDFLSYTVATTSGIEMSIDSISFNLWRNGSGAATDYAILTDQTDFDTSAALVALHLTAVGSTSDQLTITADTVGGAWTSDPIEVRLYGWGASVASGNTHFTAASMRAAFRSIGGSVVDTDGTSTLTLAGDYFQFAGATLRMELGGTDRSSEDPQYDQLIVLGDAALAGILDVSLVDGYTPSEGDTFTLVDAEHIDGVFAELLLPVLDNNMAFQVRYVGGDVQLVVQAAPEPSVALLMIVPALWGRRRMRRSVGSFK